MTIQGKKVLMIVASQDFRDEEYQKPRQILEKEGAEITVASSKKGKIKGMLGLTIAPDILLPEVRVSDYDAVIFVGGYGAQEYFTDPTAHKIAREAQRLGKITSAICIAPSILANAGILKGKKAASWSSEHSNLRVKGANVTGEEVEKDGDLITASGPAVAQEFGELLKESLGRR